MRAEFNVQKRQVVAWTGPGSRAAFDALVISFTLGALFSPPDPFTQLLYAGPVFVLSFVPVYLYGQRSGGRWWQRYLVFVGGIVTVALAWQLLAFAVGPRLSATVRPAFLLVGVAVGAWLAYFGGLDRLRGEPS